MKWRYRLQAASHRILGLHESCGLGFPDSLIESVEAYVMQTDDGSHMLTLREPYSFECETGDVDHPEIRAEFEKQHRITIPAFQLACLENVTLRSRDAYLLSPGRRAVFLASARSLEKFRKDAARDAFRRRPTRALRGRYFLGFDRWGYNYYYHWMVETLSRFLALDNVPEDVKIVLPRRTQPYMLRSLELFGGVSPDRYVYCDGEDWELEECWFPTKPYGWFLPSRREVVEVSRRILGNFRGSSRGLGAERLYVSRGRCASRRLANEEEISRFLESRGFVTWYPEEDSLDQQIATCQDARVIVSSFGSAMANLMFCKPGADVIILYDETYFDPCNWVLGACFDHRMRGVSYGPRRPLSVEALARQLPSPDQHSR